MWGEADRRDDLLHKASAAVARPAEVVVTGTLHLAGLLRDHRIARSLSEVALGRLVMVRREAERLGGLALGAPRFLPSGRRCACYGAVNAGLVLGEWSCPCCGAVLDRDCNAPQHGQVQNPSPKVTTCYSGR